MRAKRHQLRGISKTQIVRHGQSFITNDNNSVSVGESGEQLLTVC